MCAQQKLFLARKLLDAAFKCVNDSRGKKKDKENSKLRMQRKSDLHTMQSCSGTYLALTNVCDHKMRQAAAGEHERAYLPRLALNFGVSASEGTGMRISTLFAVLRGELIEKSLGEAIEVDAPSQFKLALRFDQIFNAGVGVRLDYSLDPNERAHGG